MDADNELFALYETSESWKKLSIKYLEPDKYREPKRSPYINIMDQMKGVNYHIPFNVRGFGGYSHGDMELSKSHDEGSYETDVFFNHRKDDSDYIIKNETTAIDDFFKCVEACRRDGIPMYLCEKQYFVTENKKKELKPIPEGWDSADFQVPPTSSGGGRPADDLGEISGDEQADEVGGVGGIGGIGEVADPHDPRDARDPLDRELESTVLPTHSKVEELANNLHVDKSGIELDFDIFQRSDRRQISDVDYYQLTNQIANLICATTHIPPNIPGMTDDNYIYTYAIILRKPEVVFVKHKEHGECYKDSFHLRFPGIKMSKVYKQYLMNRIIRDGVLERCLRSITTLLNPFEQVLDSMSAIFPPMLLGSMKKSGTVPHEFYKLIHLQMTINTPTPMILMNFRDDFNPINDPEDTVKIKDPVKGGNFKMSVKPVPKYKYNLVHECSLLYEAPHGLVIKREFDAKPAIQGELRAFAERHAIRGDNDGKQIINDDEINAVNDSVTTICNRNFEASYLRELLDILSPQRTSDYETWRKIIYMLAWANLEYKPLAIYFSMRNPSSWIKNGLAHLSDNWNWALEHKPQKDSSDFNSVKILNAWAKVDNPEEYKRIQIHNTRAILSKRANQDKGDLTEQSVAEILYSMFSGKFISDADASALSTRSRIWYEFVYPEDADEYGYEYGHAFKWRIEEGRPDNLDKYICKKLPLYIDSHIEYNKELINKIITELTETAENQNATQTRIDQLTKRKGYYEIVNKNLAKVVRKLGTVGFISAIISRCEIEFRRRGFNKALDNNPDYVGVGNGVLQLFPKVELIQRYHEIPISRYTKVDYVPYDINNPIIKETEEALKRLFATPEGVYDEETYHFVLMYLSTSLHGRKKKPLFMMFIGEGRAGKTTLAELHINALGTIDKKNPGLGYGNKLETTFFTSPRPGGSGPDSQKMTIKNARYCYAEETDEGDSLYMGRVKEYTGGGHITGNDKNSRQETFLPSCIWLFISNYKPKIRGSDYAAWRRILLIIFRRRFMPPGEFEADNPLHYPDDPKWQEEVPKNPAYLSAYLSILVHFHEILQTKYGGDIKSVPHKNILGNTKAYQNEQDIYSKFISERAVHIGKFYPGTTRKPAGVTMEDITNKFKKWFVNNIESTPPSAQDIHHHIKETVLSKYEMPGISNWTIEEWVILNPGEIFNLQDEIDKILREDTVQDSMDGLGDATDIPNDTPSVPEDPDDPDDPDSLDNIELPEEYKIPEKKDEDLIDDLDDL